MRLLKRVSLIEQLSIPHQTTGNITPGDENDGAGTNPDQANSHLKANRRLSLHSHRVANFTPSGCFLGYIFTPRQLAPQCHAN